MTEMVKSTMFKSQILSKCDDGMNMYADEWLKAVREKGLDKGDNHILFEKSRFEESPHKDNRK